MQAGGVMPPVREMEPCSAPCAPQLLAMDAFRPVRQREQAPLGTPTHVLLLHVHSMCTIQASLLRHAAMQPCCSCMHPLCHRPLWCRLLVPGGDMPWHALVHLARLAAPTMLLSCTALLMQLACCLFCTSPGCKLQAQWKRIGSSWHISHVHDDVLCRYCIVCTADWACHLCVPLSVILLACAYT